MNVSDLGPKTIFINLDLLFDIYSTLFSAYRAYFAKHSISISTFKHCIEGKSMADGLTSLVQTISQDLDLLQVREELAPFVDVSFRCIKPVIGVYTLLKDLAKNGTVVKIYTNLEDNLINYIKTAHKEWLSNDILQIKDREDMKQAMNYLSKQTTIMINSSVNCCIAVREEEEVPTVFVPFSKKNLEDLIQNEKLKETLDTAGVIVYESLEDIDWNKLKVLNTLKYPESSYYLQLDTTPKNAEYQLWTNNFKLEKPIELTSDIIHGFGRGGKKLGIPTANLDMKPQIEEALVNLVSGVYYGWAEFIPASQTEKNEGLEYNNKLPMVMSIGFNPYFNNKYKTAEVHIMRKFDKDFYETTLRVSVLGFIRTEADFMKFSHLIEAIHNDVQVAKDALNATDSL